MTPPGLSLDMSTSWVGITSIAGRRLLAGVFAVAFSFATGGCVSEAGGDKVPTWTVEREARIGGVDDERYPWAYVRELAVGPEGRLYVAPSQIASVWVYEADGRHVRTIGRSGEGPGEFSAVTDLGFRGDTLWVRDASAGTLSLFELEGRYLGRIHFSIPNPAGNLILRPGRLLGDGSVFSEPLYRMRAVADGDLDRVPLLRLTRQGTVTDTLAWKILRRDALRIEFEWAGTALTGGHPLPASILYAMGPSEEALYLADPEPSPGADPFVVMKLGLSGDTLWRREYEFTPIPLDDGYLDSLIEETWERRSSLHEEMTEARYREAYLESLDAPPHLPPVTDLEVNTDGAIWLRREERHADTIGWWVLASDGEPLAELEIPASIRVLAVDGDEIWGVETDELDVPYLVRLGLRRGSR